MNQARPPTCLVLEFALKEWTWTQASARRCAQSTNTADSQWSPPGNSSCTPATGKSGDVGRHLETIHEGLQRANLVTFCNKNAAPEPQMTKAHTPSWWPCKKKTQIQIREMHATLCQRRMLRPLQSWPLQTQHAENLSLGKLWPLFAW